MKSNAIRLGLALALAALPAAAFAHPQVGSATGFLTGFLHPISGLDHIIAMVAVGLWGAQLGSPAIWMLPVTFPIVMAFGGFLGLVGVPVPYVEIGIALSGVLLGAAVLIESPAAALDRRGSDRDLRDLPRARAWRRVAGGYQRTNLLDRFRCRDRAPARLRHRDRNHTPLVLWPARPASPRRLDQRRGRLLPGAGV